jgi:hypothetical protein
MTRNTRWIIIAVVAAVLVIVGIYVWQSQPAATPPPTDTPTPAAVPTNTPIPAEQPASPLGQPVSPLGQPDSPLSRLDPNAIVANQARPIDRAAIVNLVNSTTAPPPQEGMASVSAVLYSYSINQAIFGTFAYLTPADVVDGTPVPPSVYFGPQPENGDIGMETNAQGQFVVDNVPPGDYYLAVWTVYDWPAAFTSPDDAIPVRISVEAGDRLDLGLLYVEWP